MGAGGFVGVSLAVVLGAAVLSPASPGVAGEARGGADNSSLARGTARAAEGMATRTLPGVKSRTLMGKEAAVTPRLRSKTRKAFRASGIAAGRWPTGRMPVEPYVPQNACYALEMPGLTAFRDMLLETFPRPRSSLGMYNISRGCNTPGTSEHEEGRALDFEANIDNPLQYAQARQLLRYLTKRNGFHAKRWGIMYIIYNKQIWAQYRPWWRRMADRGNKVDNHQDHIHFSFTWNGAVKQSAYWTGAVRSPDRGPCVRHQWHFAAVREDLRVKRPRTWGCKRPQPFDRSWDYSASIMFWQGGDRVKWLQQFLTEEGVYSAETNGAFGQITFGAVREWQRLHRLPQTGVWDPVTQDRSGRVVGRRGASQITGWPVSLPQQPAAGQVLELPVDVTSDGFLPRTLSVQRRPGDSGKWTTVAQQSTDGAGAAVVLLPVEPGPWQYRLTAAETSAFRWSSTAALAVDTPVPPLPQTTGAPDPSPTPTPVPTSVDPSTPGDPVPTQSTPVTDTPQVPPPPAAG